MTIDIKELPQVLQDRLTAISLKDEIMIYDGIQPKARIVLIGTPKRRVPGLLKGSMEMADDFDAPLPDEFWLNETPT